MTSPTAPPVDPADVPAQQIEADPNLVNTYLSQRLAVQIDETAQTWAALQKLHQEKRALEAERNQLRAEVVLLREHRDKT